MSKILIESIYKNIEVKEGLVAIFDVSGTKYRDNDSLRSLIESINKNIKLVSTNEILSNLNVLPFKSCFFQDTIVFYYECDVVNLCQYLVSLQRISSVFFVACLNDQLPLRGVINFGSYVVLDDKAILGNVINECFEYHEQFDMYGIIIHHNLNNFLNNYSNHIMNRFNDITFNEPFYRYLIPFKKHVKNCNICYTINWLFGLIIFYPADDLGHSNIVELYAGELIDILDLNKETKKKIIETKKYIKDYFKLYPEIAQFDKSILINYYEG